MKQALGRLALAVSMLLISAVGCSDEKPWRENDSAVAAVKLSCDRFRWNDINTLSHPVAEAELNNLMTTPYYPKELIERISAFYRGGLDPAKEAQELALRRTKVVDWCEQEKM